MYTRTAHTTIRLLTGCMSTRFILACAGRQSRWQNYMGTPKHLLRIDDERLLDRAVRLIRARHEAPEIAVMALDDAHADAYTVDGTERFCPVADMKDIAALERHYALPHFMACRARWNDAGRTVIVLGDVYFTTEAMDRICNDDRGVRFYGRSRASETTGTPWGELFAISFDPDDHSAIDAAYEALRSTCGERTIRGWQLYRHLNGLPPYVTDCRNPIADNDRFVEIDDFTDDFDFPSDYDNWICRWNSRSRN